MARGIAGLVTCLLLAGAWHADAAANDKAPSVPRSLVKTNLTAGLRPGAKTNNAPQAGKPGAPAFGPGAKTNAAQAKGPAGTNAVSGGALSRLQNTVAQWRSSRMFYPVVGVIAVGLAVLGFFAFRSGGKQKTEDLPASVLSRLPKRTGKQLAIHSCNVLASGPAERHVWQFDAGFGLNREQSTPNSENLPSLVAKDWTNLWQRKLNVAWLPPEYVFLRVAQFPKSDFAETVAMAELQLEKLSPMPVAQIVWSLQILPHAEGDMQTVVVLIAARNAVEEFLGQLEGQGFMADRLELPLLDQLQTTVANEDGAWIYPEAAGGKGAAVVAWWCRGVLQSLDLLNLPTEERAAGLKEQLLQMAWAGEMEGWLTTARPSWHLVAEPEIAAEWEPPLREGLEQPLQVAAPLKPVELAGLTARRAASADAQANLMPPEFATKYQQQFYDRLWMRGLGAVLGLYLIGVLIYGIAVGFATYRTQSVEDSANALSGEYTNVMQLKAKYKVLKEREDLKFAALDCYKAVAETMPADASLESINFSEGKRLALQGTAPADKVPQLYEFESALRKRSLFDPLKSENLSYRANPGSATVTWMVTLQLKGGTL